MAIFGCFSSQTLNKNPGSYVLGTFSLGDFPDFGEIPEKWPNFCTPKITIFHRKPLSQCPPKTRF